ncbi:MAG: uncharacterized protein JWR45_2346 [Blastococcus sp.]|jgi:hypothetical protein|nr:uncharacterized protein [Blastococcus sp.]
MQITPEALEEEFTLPTAATRLDFLSRRDNGDTALNTVHDADDDWASSLLASAGTSLDIHESLELLALGEVVARKAHGSRLIGLRAALRAGASWDDVAAALGVSPQQAWDTYTDAVSTLDPEAAASARELAGSRPAR